jgi:hypothetical protein
MNNVGRWVMDEISKSNFAKILKNRNQFKTLPSCAATHQTTCGVSQ